MNALSCKGTMFLVPAMNMATGKGFGCKHPHFLKYGPAATVAPCACRQRVFGRSVTSGSTVPQIISFIPQRSAQAAQQSCKGCGQHSMHQNLGLCLGTIVNE